MGFQAWAKRGPEFIGLLGVARGIVIQKSPVETWNIVLEFSLTLICWVTLGKIFFL